MKTYRVEYTPFPNGKEHSEAIDLVNVEDDSDYLMANWEDFKVGEIITEDEFEMIECPYIDAQENYQSAGNFAFKKKILDEAELLTF